MSISNDAAADWPSDLLDGYRGREWWHADPATDAQMEALERRGWRPPLGLTKGEAHWALGRPSRKQRRALERRGLWRAGVTFEGAREALDAVARHEGWGR
jgi:hypothetical protein